MQKTLVKTNIYLLVWKNSTFFLPYKILFNMKKIKNIKISIESHEMLKTYCDKHGLKIYKFLEFMIKKTCEEKKDIYGE